jgi:prepilin-type N-terminal cleavage/methylation domain-containing protein
MTRTSRRAGFTLIELLVVMAIIATLASLGVVGIPAYLRRAERMKSMDNLKQIGALLKIYEMDYKGLPKADGAEFVLALWGRGVDKNVKDAELFFCPSTKNRPAADLSNITAAGIDYTGPDLQNYRARNWISSADRNAGITGVVANKVPANDGRTLEEIKNDLPHHGVGVAVLYLSGATGFIFAEDFADEIPVFGPDSPHESLRLLKAGFGDE